MACAQEALETKNVLKSILSDSAEEAKNVALAVVACDASAGGSGLAAVPTLAAGAPASGSAGNDEVEEDAPMPGTLKRKSRRAQSLDSDDSKKLKSDAGKGKGYSKEEALCFSAQIAAIGKDQDAQRMKCSADDAIASLNWVIEAEFTEAERKSSEEAIMKAKGLAFSLFSEFLLAGEVVVGGKKIKIWSALRPELQGLVRMAKAKLSVEGCVKDPVTLAREITEELINAPVQMVVEGEDDGFSRISQYLQKKPQAVEKIRKMVEESLDLPLYMHDVVPALLKLCLNKTMQLVDYLAAVFTEIDSRLPASMIGFAADVCNYFAASQGFASGCQHVGCLDSPRSCV